MLKSFNRWIGKSFGFMLKRRDNLYKWQQDDSDPSSAEEISLPPGADSYLKANNQRLIELKQRYSLVDATVTKHAVWSEGKITEHDLRFFRGDNPFVWQRPGLNSNDLAYVLTYFSLKSGTPGMLLNDLDEDGLFGAKTIEIEGRLVSRDLLDSVREIDFLKTHAGLGEATLSVLDIGAGYGRLAHRLNQTTSHNVKIFAIDAFPQSTFLSEYYLKFRNADRVRVIPLDKVDEFLLTTPIDLAVNIHSFSECTLDAIAWWTERLSTHRVRYLMIIPNNEAREGVVQCTTNTGEDMESVFARFGYQPKIREPRHLEPIVQRYGLDPAQLNLFELS